MQHQDNRLKIIIILTVFLTFMYVCEIAFLTTASGSNYRITDEGIEDKNIDVFIQDTADVTDESLKEGDEDRSITDIIGGFIGSIPIIGDIFSAVVTGFTVFVGLLTFVGSMLTFSLPQIPSWMKIILSPMVIIIWIIICYILISYVYDGFTAIRGS